MADPLLSLRGIVKHYPVRGGVFQRVTGHVQAVNGVDLDVFEGEALGLVGESGCGKSTLGRTLLRLDEPDEGSIVFDGRDITHIGRRDMRTLRSDMQLIFQDPYSSLDPRATIADSVGEGLRVQEVAKRDRIKLVHKALDLVGLETYQAKRFPHEFSGGQRQRIGIARALVMKPRFLVLDEPVSALDVSIQAQVLNLLKDLQKRLNLTLLFIAHDLSVVEHLCDRIAVMYLGKIVEIADGDALFKNATHPYTQALLSAIPIPDPTVKRSRIILEGDLPSPINPLGVVSIRGVRLRRRRSVLSRSRRSHRWGRPQITWRPVTCAPASTPTLTAQCCDSLRRSETITRSRQGCGRA